MLLGIISFKRNLQSFFWKILIKIQVFGLSDPRPPALKSGPRSPAPAPMKVLTSSAFSQVKSSHYDHVHSTFNGLRGILNMLFYSCHRYMFVDFLLCLTDKCMFKVNNKKNQINMHVFKFKNKYSMPSFFCFYCLL